MSDAITLITGGSGYFGCLLRDRLLARGQRVRVLDLVDLADRPEGVEFVEADIRDAEAVRRACQGVEVVFHNVAQVPLAKDKALFWSVNYTGTENLIEAVLAEGARKLVYTSSSAVFGVPPRNPVDEDVVPVPGEAYGEAKLKAEHRLRRAVEEHGLDAAIVRPRTILGHGRLGIFQILFDWVAEGANIPVLGAGDNLYQFVHADDLAELCILASEHRGFGVYLGGSDRYCTMRETLEALCEHAGTGSRVRSMPMAPAVWGMNLTSALGMSPLGPYHALMYGRSLYFDISRTQAELGWQPRYSNQQMICESYDWYLAHKAEVLAGPGASPHSSAVKQGVLGLVKRLL